MTTQASPHALYAGTYTTRTLVCARSVPSLARSLARSPARPPACRLPPLPATTTGPPSARAQPRSDVRDAAILSSPSGFSSNERHVVAQIIDCARTLDVRRPRLTARRRRRERRCVSFHSCGPQNLAFRLTTFGTRLVS